MYYSGEYINYEVNNEDVNFSPTSVTDKILEIDKSFYLNKHGKKIFT